MDVSVAEAKNHLPELIRAVEAGEKVVITRHGKRVAQLTPPPAGRREIQWGTMREGARPTIVELFLESVYLLDTGIALLGLASPGRMPSTRSPRPSSEKSDLLVTTDSDIPKYASARFQGARFTRHP